MFNLQIRKPNLKPIQNLKPSQIWNQAKFNLKPILTYKLKPSLSYNLKPSLTYNLKPSLTYNQVRL